METVCNFQDIKLVHMRLRPGIRGIHYLQGDFSLAKKKLAWEPKVKFDRLVEIMVKEDLQRWQKWLKGERFPWDAPNYPSENKILSRMWRLER